MPRGDARLLRLRVDGHDLAGLVADEVDHVEDITGAAQVWVPAARFPELIAAGRITDAMTLSALALASCAG